MNQLNRSFNPKPRDVRYGVKAIKHWFYFACACSCDKGAIQSRYLLFHEGDEMNSLFTNERTKRSISRASVRFFKIDFVSRQIFGLAALIHLLLYWIARKIFLPSSLLYVPCIHICGKIHRIGEWFHGSKVGEWKSHQARTGIGKPCDHRFEPTRDWNIGKKDLTSYLRRNGTLLYCPSS